MTKVPPDLQTEEIFVNGERQILARYPNYDPEREICRRLCRGCHLNEPGGPLVRSRRRLFSRYASQPVGRLHLADYREE